MDLILEKAMTNSIRADASYLIDLFGIRFSNLRQWHVPRETECKSNPRREK